jgi:predicted DNA-binding transcriptional regulator AlpA
MLLRNYTIPQFLEVFNLSKSTLYRLWEQGRGPQLIRIGRRVLIPVDAAEEWAARQIEKAQNSRS